MSEYSKLRYNFELCTDRNETLWDIADRQDLIINYPEGSDRQKEIISDLFKKLRDDKNDYLD